MRIWDVSPTILCKNHLLGEHRELHAVWTVISQDKKGYSKHPETLRWYGKLAALYKRHEALVEEMSTRGYQHNSPLDKKLAVGSVTQTLSVHTPEEQIEILRAKKCECKLPT
jgi:hypothetical protein